MSSPRHRDKFSRPNKPARPERPSRPGKPEKPEKPPTPLERLHEGLIGERLLAGKPYLDEPDLLEAYDKHFSPQSYAKAKAVLEELGRLAAAGELPFSSPKRIFDVGAGPGAMAAAAKALFPGAEVVALDRSLAALGRVPEGIVRKPWDLTMSPPEGLGRADIVLLGNVLSELEINEAAFLSFLLDQLTTPKTETDAGGFLVVVEPALKETARVLERARDTLVKDLGLFVVAPCFYRGGCPALLRERDWCHEDRLVDGVRVKYAYLVLRRRGDWRTDMGRFRIVSDRFSEKGRQHYFGCGPAGRHPLVRLRRFRSEANDAFSDLERGDVVDMNGLVPKGTDLRVVEETTVKVARSGHG